ncbi:SGNH/GDSL hydrolase family protein [Butyrivibrio sp. JL13D10]|uniref:SGNH/GDSL hydrolase family protein n=1 Tax=Butyrivibrio sp. JL13D10 TaxID=3236815 RepID=UPI0038B41E67
MKRRFVTCILTLLTTATMFGCGDPSKLTSKSSENQVTEIQEEEADPAKAEVPDAASSAEENSGEDNSATESTEQPVSADQGGENAVSTGDSAAATEGVSVTEEEIVEPELPTEEVQQPVETTVVEETKDEEKDKYYDIVFIGDSQFDNARGTGSEIPAYTCSLLGKKAKYYNLAIGGTAASLGREMSTDLETFNDSSFIGICYALAGKIKPDFLDQYACGAELKKVKPQNVDLYIIEYGANDYINGKDLYNSNAGLDPHTYSGALASGIGELKAISPNAQFILCGPSYCQWYNGSGAFMGDAFSVSKGIGPLTEYANTASNLASTMGITYFDTMYASQFDLKIETAEMYLADGLHYTEKGRQIYAAVLAHTIQKLRGKDVGDMPYLEINSFDFWAYKDSLKKK